MEGSKLIKDEVFKVDLDALKEEKDVELKVKRLYESNEFFEDVRLYNEVCDNIIQKIYTYKKQGIMSYIKDGSSRFGYGEYTVEAYLELQYEGMENIKIKVDYLIIENGELSKVYQDSDGFITIEEL